MFSVSLIKTVFVAIEVGSYILDGADRALSGRPQVRHA